MRYLSSEEKVETTRSIPPENVETNCIKILVIDDEATLVKLMAEMLAIMGYDTVSSTSSIEGLRIFKKAPNDFSLVITDLSMPELPGDMLVKEMVSIRKSLPVILCTGFNESISETQARRMGINELLTKPVNMKILSRAINKALGIRNYQ